MSNKKFEERVRNTVIFEHNEDLWYDTDMRTDAYEQVVVIPACIVERTDEKGINDYLHAHIKGMTNSIKLIGCVETVHDGADGKRIDAMFLIHFDDIPKFAVQRFGLDMPLRWLEDLLGNDMERGAQTYADSFLQDYPPAWTYSAETQWHEYPCYEGTWRVVA